MLFQAIQFATDKHKDQKRKFNGRPYITHPLRVMSRTLLIPGCTEGMAIAAILHDVVEDCGVTVDEIKKMFGFDVADLVVGLTNTSKITHPHANRAERKKIDRDRLYGCSKQVKQIKLIDRADNLTEMPICKESEKFIPVYIEESKDLLFTLTGADNTLADELCTILYAKEREWHNYWEDKMGLRKA